MASTVAPCFDICSRSSLFCAGQKRDMIALDSNMAASSVVGGLTLITKSDFHTWNHNKEEGKCTRRWSARGEVGEQLHIWLISL